MKKLMLATIVVSVPVVSFAQSLTWNGDFRFRHERYDQKSNTTHYEKYNQERMNLRLGATAKPTEDVSVEARLATGTGGTSTLQTLSDTTANANKNYDIKLDRANIVYTPMEKLDLSFGRMGVKFEMAGGSDMLFDSDLNLDGAHVGYLQSLGSVDLGLRLGSFQIVQDRTLNAKESSMQAYQLFAKGGIGEMKYTFTTALYNFVNLDQVNVGANTNAGVDFEVFNTGFELKLPFALPVSLFADYAKNVAGETQKKGDATMFGFKVNGLKEAKSWVVTYDYRKVEKYSTAGLYTDGDSFYSGTTDGKGHRVKVGYQLNNALALGVNYFDGKSTISTTSKDFSKFQFDIAAKF